MERHRMGVALLATLALTACGITVEDAANQFGSPYCRKVQAWFPDSFGQTYPGGLPQCEDQWTQGYSTQDLSQTDGCNQSQLDACVSAVNSMIRGTSLDNTPLPSTCDLCTAIKTSATDGG